MSVKIHRLPKRLHHKVIIEYRAGNKQYILRVFKVHKMIVCSTCIHWSNIIEWVEYAIAEKIWDEHD